MADSQPFRHNLFLASTLQRWIAVEVYLRILLSFSTKKVDNGFLGVML